MPSNLRPLRPLARTAETSRERASRRLAEALEASGLSQERAGELLGVDARQVRKWLHGEVRLGPLELLVELETAALKKRRAA
jgi:transcriptional regulator with XRE-family HTH domain